MAPERLERWCAGFADRHGAPTQALAPDRRTFTLHAPDGAVATFTVPAGGLPPDLPTTLEGLVAHARAPRRTGVVLVRLGGFALGVFEGERLLTHTTGARLVHGRSAAGGWSQQRFARRREGQAAVALQAAADAVARLLLPEPLNLVVTGGDKGALDTVFADRRLAPLVPLLDPRVLDVPEPRHAVLRACGFRDVRLHLVEPAA